MEFEKLIAEQFTQCMVTIVVALFGLITLKLEGFIRTKSNILKAQSKNELTKSALHTIEKLVIDTVKCFNQTIVKSIKEASDDGVITKEEAEEIKNLAVNQVMETMSEELYTSIQTIVGNVEQYIGILIEKEIYEQKQFNQPIFSITE